MEGIGNLKRHACRAGWRVGMDRSGRFI